MRSFVLALSLVVSSWVSVAEAAPPTTGQQLFTQHCARCHTTSGSGLPNTHPLLSEFDQPPADFTDGLFNSTEPARDWFNVVKFGGAAMGLSDQMPAHSDRLSDDEIRRVVRYLGTFADTRGYPSGDLNFRRPVATIKAFPETELLVLGRFEQPEVGPATWRSTLYHARRVGKQVSVEAKLSHIATADDNELDEIELGVKWAAVRAGSSFLLSLGAEAAFAIDDAGAPEMIPYASYAAPLGTAFTLQGTLKSHLPTDAVSDGDVATSHAVHWLSSSMPRGVFPGLEAVASAAFDDGEISVAVIPQVFFAFSKRGHVGVAVGAEIPAVGETFDYRAHTFLFWDMADGPFWEGW